MEHIEFVHCIKDDEEYIFFHCQKYIHLCFILHFNVPYDVCLLVLTRISEHVSMHAWKFIQFLIQENKLIYHSDGIDFNLVFSQTTDYLNWQKYSYDTKIPMPHYTIGFGMPCQGDPKLNLTLSNCRNYEIGLQYDYTKEWDGTVVCCKETTFTPEFIHLEKEDMFKIKVVQKEHKKRINKLQFYWKLKEVFDIFVSNLQK